MADSESDSSINTEPYPQLQYCVRCCLPETVEGIRFDDRGICSGCNSAEQKMAVDWSKREQALREKLAHYKSISGENYDCVVPISGNQGLRSSSVP